MLANRQSQNCLGLAVLALLAERPMHPYEMAATLRERHKERSIKLRYGSLYTVIEALQRDALILAQERVRKGRRPERTVFEITPAGRAELERWMADILSVPVKEYPRFEAALSFISVLPPETARSLLIERQGRLAKEIEGLRRQTGEALEGGVAALFLIENDFRLAMAEAELTFVAALVQKIKQDAIAGIDLWRSWHAGRAEGGGVWPLPPGAVPASS